MWVWRGLGYDNVGELPSGALGALGRRCRQAQDFGSAWSRALPTDGGQDGGLDHPAESICIIDDEDGERVEVYVPAATSLGEGTGVASTHRLAPLRKLRLCIPGTVELHPAGDATAESMDGGKFNSLGDALSNLICNRGGACTWHVPMVDARLRADIADECCYTPAPQEWPFCVTGSVLGASLEILVTAPWPPTDSPNRRGGWTPMQGMFKEEPPIECDGFMLQFLQRGGPPLDPRRLSDCKEDVVVEELERWASRNLASRPDTWCTLNVTKQEAETQPSAPMPMPTATARRQTGDVIIAVAADTEVSLEPFELSYGDAHIGQLRRMLEDEIAHVLGIASERVMCGDFMPSSRLRPGAPKRKHLKNNSIGIRFALLHSELEDLRKPKDVDTRKNALPRPKMQLGMSNGLSTVGFGTQSSKTLALPPPKGPKGKVFDGITIPSAFQMQMKDSLMNAGAAMTQLSANAQSLKGAKYGNRLPFTGMQTSASSPTLGVAKPGSPGPDLPPDLLLKRLISILSDPKHPLRRHPDVFPMLSRLSGEVRTTATLVIDRKVAEPGQMAEGLKTLMKRLAVSKTDVGDTEMRMKMTGMRSEIMSIYEGPGGDVLAQQRQLTGLSAKELLDELEGSVSRPTDLRAALLMLLDHTDKDVEWCLRLRSHKAVERILSLSRRFNNDKSVVSKGVGIIGNLTRNDPGCVDRLLENNLAPDFILTLENYPQEPKIQLNGTQVLRRMYHRARELAAHGPRVVILGKNVPEVWTFKGLERVLINMRLFGEDAAIQVECLTLLSTLGEVLFNNGMAGEVFQILEVLMRRHSVRADILAKGVLIIARLGPSFLQHEHRGVFTIIQAMGRHRSDVELQRVGTRALLSLAREEKALHQCKAGGSVAATMLAMSGHSQDEQVLREGARLLEKLCPRALAKVIHLCGDLGTVLPPVSWNEYTHGSAWEPVLQDSEWNAQLLKNFREDVVVNPRRRNPSSSGVGFGDDDDEVEAAADDGPMTGGRLATTKGYRKAGLREEFDASDTNWATSSLVKSRSETRDRDIRALESAGGNSEKLRPAGPTSEHLRKLCEALSGGLSQQFGAQDGELLASTIGHFCWCSASTAREIVNFGGASGLVAWLRAPRFKTGRSPEESELAHPMQRACLGALSSLCQQDEALAGQVLTLGGAQLALDFASHIDQRVQRAAMRLLSRLIPVAKQDKPASEKIPREQAWSFVIRELRDSDELSRTCAAAAALEIVEDGWILSEEGNQVEELAVNLLYALNRAVDCGNAGAGLPLLLAIGRMLTEAEDEGKAAKSLLSSQGQRGQPNEKRGQSLVQLLAFWLPKGVATGAMAADKGAAIAAAVAMQSLSEFEAPLPFREMRELMVCGQSTRAEPALREACRDALLLSVNCENQPQQLAYLFATSVGKGPGGEDRLADIKILRSIADRILQLLRAAQGQATDSLLAALDKAEHLLPRESQDDHAAVVSLLAEARSFRGVALNAALPEDDEEEAISEDGLADLNATLPLLSSTLEAGSRPPESPLAGAQALHAKSSPAGLIAAASR